MRKTIAGLLFAASLPLLAPAVMAGPEQGDCPMAGERGMMMGGGPGHERGHGMFGGLELKAEQRATLHQAMRDYRQREHARVQAYLDKLPAAEKAAMEQEAAASRQQRDQAIEAVLTPEQLKQYRSMSEAMEKRRAEREEFEAWKAQRDAGKSN